MECNEAVKVEGTETIGDLIKLDYKTKEIGIIIKKKYLYSNNKDYFFFKVYSADNKRIVNTHFMKSGTMWKLKSLMILKVSPIMTKMKKRFNQ